MFAIDMLYSHCYYCLCLLLTCFIHIAIMRCMFEDNMHLLYHIYMVLIRLNQHILIYFVFYYPHLRTSLHCAIHYFSVKEWHKNPYFEGMVNQIYPPELQLNKANISDTEAPFLAHLSRRLTR